MAWDPVRGAFVVDGSLFYAKADGLIYRRTWTAAGTFGPAVLVDPYNDPFWSTIGTGSGSGVYRGSRPSLYGSELAVVTGMAYLSDRIVYTLSGSNQLYWRWFSPDSGIVGPRRNSVAGAVMPTDVRGLFVADGYLWYAHGSGTLSRQQLNGVALVPGSTQLMGGPTVDGVDWRSRALFAGPGPQPPANVLPDARFAISCTQLTCSFDASTSTDSDGTITSYSWTFSDGGNASGVSAARTFASAGTYTIELTVTDNRGGTATLSQDITVSTGNVAPTSAFSITCTDLSCSFDGSGSFDSDGTIVAYEWSFGDGADSTGLTTTHAYPGTGTYEARLDGRGQRRSANDAGAERLGNGATGDHRLPRVANRAGDIHDRDRRHACCGRSRRRPAPVRDRQLPDADDPGSSGMDGGGSADGRDDGDGALVAPGHGC